jgi:hypothetical protein
MTDPSVDNGVVNGRRSGGRSDGGLDTSAGVVGLLGEYDVGLPATPFSDLLLINKLGIN